MLALALKFFVSVCPLHLKSPLCSGGDNIEAILEGLAKVLALWESNHLLISAWNQRTCPREEQAYSDWYVDRVWASLLFLRKVCSGEGACGWGQLQIPTSHFALVWVRLGV